jgi:hypothetical protein
MRPIVEEALEVVLCTNWNYIYYIDHYKFTRGFLETQSVMEYLDSLELTNEEYNHLMKVKFEIQKWH